jgi:hypothetical protein
VNGNTFSQVVRFGEAMRYVLHVSKTNIYVRTPTSQPAIAFSFLSVRFQSHRVGLRLCLRLSQLGI